MRQMVLGFVVFVSALIPVAAAAQTQTLAKDGTKVGNWEFKRDIDEMTGKAAPDIRAYNFDADKPQSLMFWCSAKTGELNALFTWNKYFAASGSITVMYKFGAEPVLERPWRVLGNDSAVLWLGRTLTEFAEQVRSHDSVLMRVVDTDGETITTRFDITGAPEAMKLLPCAATGQTASLRGAQ